MSEDRDPLPKLAAPAQRALASAGIHFLQECERLTREEALALHGMGPNAMAKLEAELTAKGLEWKTSSFGKL